MTRVGDERRSGCDLEECDGLAVIRGFAFFQDRQKRIFLNRHAVERDTLLKADQMRGRIGMHRQPGRFGDRAHKGDGRALAVGARHMNYGGQTTFRISEGGQQPLRAVEPKIDKFRMKRRQSLKDGVSLMQVSNHRLRRCRRTQLPQLRLVLQCRY